MWALALVRITCRSPNEGGGLTQYQHTPFVLHTFGVEVEGSRGALVLIEGSRLAAKVLEPA